MLHAAMQSSRFAKHYCFYLGNTLVTLLNPNITSNDDNALRTTKECTTKEQKLRAD